MQSRWCSSLKTEHKICDTLDDINYTTSGQKVVSSVVEISQQLLGIST